VIRVLAHRGLWREPAEKNTSAALSESLRLGFGVETDVRDAERSLVISHDPPAGGESTLTQLLAEYRGTGLPLAVNVKADGLSESLAGHFSGTGIDWFAFDMSVPEMLRYAKAGLPYFTRHSDVEPDPIGYADAAGVWLDAFGADWFGPHVVRAHLDAGKRVAVVSPELHGRAPERVWEWLCATDWPEDGDLMVCSDHPERLSYLLQEQP
jgi:hypothetical protein